MRPDTALDDAMRAGIGAIGKADILVGIPSYNNAATIGHVVRAVTDGLRQHFPDARSALVSSDGGSRDDTGEVVRREAGEFPLVAGAYVGLPGKGSALRAIFECMQRLGARSGAVVDSDLRSITPEWVRRLVGPVHDGRADYVTPLYARHKHDGTITNSIAYPLTRALYGVRVRQPIGGEFGFSGELADHFVREGEWQGDVARFGIDIFMTTTALTSGARVAQAFLGAKIHDPKDPGADLAPMFSEVVGTLFSLAATKRERWQDVSGSVAAPVIGEISPVEPEVVNASVELLRSKHAAAEPEHGATWARVLGAGPRGFDAAEWARTVYAFMAASLIEPARRPEYVRALVPLYFGRVARFIEDASDLDTAAAERLVEEQALAFEREKPTLRQKLAA